MLSKITHQIGDDWLLAYAYRPVLIETFVDTTLFSGTCYQAANWQLVGQTKGRGVDDPHREHKATIKNIYLYPLHPNYKQLLKTGRSLKKMKAAYRNDLRAVKANKTVDDSFIQLWDKVLSIIRDVASAYDETWQIRKRVLNTMILILVIFRLVTSKNSQSYGTTIDDIWDHAKQLHLPLPQENAIVPSSLCVARKKLDAEVFKTINREIIDAYEASGQLEPYLWFGHRLFAVDGSKLNLPRALLRDGYPRPSENAHVPQGMVSCLYLLKTQLPFDFVLARHANERTCALRHLSVLKKDDVVVYDRGYFSYVMLHHHLSAGIHAIFRLTEASYSVIQDFFSSAITDCNVTIYPSSKFRQEILVDFPDLNIIPLSLRLIKYTIGEHTFCLGTTLTDDSAYSIQALADVYHERWGIEELYKVTKHCFIVEDFHGKCDRTVKQELFAHFVLITMNRFFANHADAQLNHPMDGASQLPDQNLSSPSVCQKIKTNFKNCIFHFMTHMEELFFLKEKMASVVNSVFGLILRGFQNVRPGRVYPRRSMKPISIWRPSKKKLKKTEDAIDPPIISPSA